jgi:hypothetical protein
MTGVAADHNLGPVLKSLPPGLQLRLPFQLFFPLFGVPFFPALRLASHRRPSVMPAWTPLVTRWTRQPNRSSRPKRKLPYRARFALGRLEVNDLIRGDSLIVQSEGAIGRDG